MLYIVGIDEAGRGPLAGPVSVGVCSIREDIVSHVETVLFGDGGIRDSKKLSHKRREIIYSEMQKLRAAGSIHFSVRMSSNSFIDENGIVFGVNFAMKKALRIHTVKNRNMRVLLDGGLRAPREYTNQITIIKGDERELTIALASIAAKVERDRVMVKMGEKYPQFGFEIHKGYGTKKHRENIGIFGISDMHRRSFLKGLTE